MTRSTKSSENQTKQVSSSLDSSQTRRPRARMVVAWTLFAATLLLPFAAEAEHSRRQGRWNFVGQGQIHGRQGRAVIPVNNNLRNIDRVMLTVQGSPLFLRGIRIHYGNGQTQNLMVRQRIAPGGHSTVIDLPNSRRFVRSIEVLTQRRGRKAYRRRGHRGPSTITLLSMPRQRRHRHHRVYSPRGYMPAPPPPTILVSHPQPQPQPRRARWAVLGQNPINHHHNHAVVPVNMGQRSVSQVLVRVENSGLLIRSVTITLMSGQQITTPIWQTIAAGGQTAAINIPQYAGQVRNVTVNYHPGQIFVAARAPQITVFGLH